MNLREEYVRLVIDYPQFSAQILEIVSEVITKKDHGQLVAVQYQ